MLGRFSKGLVAAFAISLAGFAVGCASAPAEDSADSSEAVTATEAAGSGAKQLLTDERSSEDAHGLGIVLWQVFSTWDAKTQVAGAVAYGVGEDKQVKYAVALTSNAHDAANSRVKMTLLRFDVDGPALDQTLDDATTATLNAEAVRIGGLLQVQHHENTQECVWGIGAGLFVGVLVAASVTGGILAAPLVAGVSLATATVGELLVTLGLTAGILTGITSWALGWQNTVEGAKVTVHVLGVAAADIGNACRNSLEGH